MAVPTLNARIVPQSTGGINATNWNIVFDFFDASGTYSGLDVAVGDIIYIDTSVVLLGSLSKYRITLINSKTAFNVDCNITWADSDVGNPQDPAFGVGVDQVILRETLTHGYDLVPSPGLQSLPDRFAVLPQNFTFQKIELDISSITGVSGGGVTGLRGVTGSQGATGFQGATGIGSQGVTGFQGITGIQGFTGIRGMTGIQGLPGADGLNGTTGIQGVTGPGGSGATGVAAPPLSYPQQKTLQLYGATDATDYTITLTDNLFSLPKV